MQRRIRKSGRHRKIIGEFGERLIANWLSALRFEVVCVDHVGLDLIAYNTLAKERIGITVKSRTREEVRKETSAVNLFDSQKNDRGKLIDACQAFGCEPWVGVYVETACGGDMYLTSLRNYDRKYRGKSKRWQSWKMTREYKRRYSNDPDVKHVGIAFDTERWDWSG